MTAAAHLQDQPETLSKSEFAARVNVDPSRVSHWIRDGKIGPDALDGEGRSARIIVPVALAQLKRTLDIGQRLGNGIDTRLDAPASPPPAPQSTLPLATAPGLPPPAADTVEDQIKRARLRELEFRNRAAAEKELAARGFYVRTADAQAAMTAVAAGMMAVFEGGLADLAAGLAAKFSLPQRDVMHELRGRFRDVRARAAETARRKTVELPGVLADQQAPEAGDVARAALAEEAED